MKLKTIKIESKDYKQSLVDYINAAAIVNAYSYAITQQSMPVLQYPPKNYGEFSEKFSPAKGHCLNWTNGIFPVILSFPKTIVNEANDLFDLEKTMANAYLDILKNNPKDEKAKKGLEKALNTMLVVLEQQIKTAKNLIKSLDTFSQDIIKDATALNDIATKAIEDADEDKTKIEDINKEIDRLNKEIETYQTYLLTSQMGTGVSLFIGVIGIGVCFIPGAGVYGGGIIALAVIGEAASITGWVLSQQAIDACTDMIKMNQEQIKGLNQDIILLTAINSSFKYLIEANLKAQDAIKVIMNLWTELYNVINDVKNDITNVDTDVSKEDYEKASEDLVIAGMAWDEVIKFADALAGIDYKWQDKDGNWHNFSNNPPAIDEGKVDTSNEKVS